MSEVGAPQAPGAQAPDHDLFAGIEDDIELEVGAGDDGATQQVSGAAFSRLTTERKASKEAPTPGRNTRRQSSAVKSKTDKKKEGKSLPGALATCVAAHVTALVSAAH